MSGNYKLSLTCMFAVSNDICDLSDSCPSSSAPDGRKTFLQFLLLSQVRRLYNLSSFIEDMMNDMFSHGPLAKQVGVDKVKQLSTDSGDL